MPTAESRERQGKRILFVASDLEQPSFRYRASAYFERFEKAGWRVASYRMQRNLHSSLGLLWRARGCRAVYLIRETYLAGYLWALRRSCPNVILDLDDAIFCNDDGTPSGFRRRRVRAAARASSGLVVGNPYLAQELSSVQPCCRVIPTAIRVEDYEGPAPPAPSEFFDVVWIGSRSTRRYLESWIQALELAAREIPSLRLKVIADFELASPVLPIRNCRWSQESEVRELRSSQVGLAPLPDDPWTRGKCGLKMLQYMAARIPVLASPVGVQEEILDGGRTGIAIRSPSELPDALRALLDPGLRSGLGERGHELVRRTFSVEVNFSKLLQVIVDSPRSAGRSAAAGKP